VSGD
jgi:hypothetical protein